ncbi:MAG: hypothetical protein H7841_12200 [Magnetospirillum sp. WYHS-4]
MSFCLSWREAGIEPPLHEVMSDPIVHLVMRRDGIDATHVWSVLYPAAGALLRRHRERVRAAA